ncbi:MAG: restriction endonuclease subunit S [Candidatus Moranbacteria bacterium]|nr:restriction endonuclease subunit S [Candidatus Moranbacteria bacterium]
MQKLLSGKKRLIGFNKKWELFKLKDLCVIKKGQQLNRDDMIADGIYPALNGGTEASGYTNEWNTKENTITISEGGNSCGFVNFNQEKFWCGGHCYAVSPNKNTDKLFLYQVLKLKQNRIMSLRVGSGLPNIQKTSLDDLKILFPEDIKEQKAIADILVAADQEIEKLEEKLRIIKEQKKFLLNNLITGQIRVPEKVKI